MADSTRPTLEPLDVSDACDSLALILGSWTDFVVPMEYGYRYGSGTTADTPGAVALYYYRYTFDPPDVCTGLGRIAEESSKDGRPYFSDPAQLSFNPYEVSACDRGDGEEGVPFGAVWADPLARTLWLAIKGRYLTSQYFRNSCLTTAASLRKRPPIAADDMHVPIGEGWLSNAPLYFRVQLYPYVVRALMDEGHWPYFHPGRENVAEKPLGWVAEVSD